MRSAGTSATMRTSVKATTPPPTTESRTVNRKAVKRLAKDRLPRFAWNALLRIRASAVHAFRWSLERAGYVVARRDDYYSPLMPVSRLEAKLARWNRPSALPGVAF